MKIDQEIRNKVIAVFNSELQRIFIAHPDVVSLHIAVGIDGQGTSYAALKEINLVSQEEGEDDTESLIQQIDSEISTIHNPAISEYYNGVTFTREALFAPPKPAAIQPHAWFVSDAGYQLMQ